MLPNYPACFETDIVSFSTTKLLAIHSTYQTTVNVTVNSTIDQTYEVSLVATVISTIRSTGCRSIIYSFYPTIHRALAPTIKQAYKGTGNRPYWQAYRTADKSSFDTTIIYANSTNFTTKHESFTSTCEYSKFTTFKYTLT